MTKDNDLIKKTLMSFDPNDDDVWTSDGLPRVEVVMSLSGLSGLKRSDITKIAPTFNRENMEILGNEKSMEELIVDKSNKDMSVLDESEAACREALVEVEKAKLNLKEAEIKRDRAIAEESKNNPEHPHQNQIDIMLYIESQVKLREKRLFKVNQQFSDEPKKAPIDRAFAPKRGFGMSRPKGHK